MDEEIHFFTWIDLGTLAIVTRSAVFHWSINDPNSRPEAVFKLGSQLVQADILEYRRMIDNAVQAEKKQSCRLK